MLNVIMLSALMLNVANNPSMLSVVMLSVKAPPSAEASGTDKLERLYLTIFFQVVPNPIFGSRTIGIHIEWSNIWCPSQTLDKPEKT
jgi:hypothetical protein